MTTEIVPAEVITDLADELSDNLGWTMAQDDTRTHITASLRKAYDLGAAAQLEADIKLARDEAKRLRGGFGPVSSRVQALSNFADLLAATRDTP